MPITWKDEKPLGVAISRITKVIETADSVACQVPSFSIFEHIELCIVVRFAKHSKAKEVWRLN